MDSKGKFEGLLEKMNTHLNAMPPVVKETAPNILNAAGQFINAGVIFTRIDPLFQIVQNLHPEAVCTHEAASALINEASQNYTVVADHSDVLLKHLTSNLECPEEVKSAVVGELSTAGNYLLATSIVCGGLQLVVNIVCLWNLFESIKDAKNVVASSPNGKKSILERFKKITEKLKEFDDIFKQLNEGGINLEKISLLSIQTTRKKDAIEKELRETLYDIENLEVKIKNSKTKLGAARRQMMTCCVGGAASGINGIVTLAVVGTSAMNPVLLICASVIAVANIIVVVAGATFVLKSRKQLDQLVKELVKIHELFDMGKLCQSDIDAETEKIFAKLEMLTLKQKD